MIWHRTRRRPFFRATIAFLSGIGMLVLACSVEAGGTGEGQWRSPSRPHVVAAPTAIHPACILAQRPLLPIGSRQPQVTVERRAPRMVAVLPARQGEGSLPPCRHCYRRTVHDARSEPPA